MSPKEISDPEPESSTPSTPSKDKRRGSDRQWKATVEHVRGMPEPAVIPLLRDMCDALVRFATEAERLMDVEPREQERGLQALAAGMLEAATVRPADPDGAWTWQLSCSDVDGKAWDHVDGGTAASKAEAVAAATALRDANVLGDVTDSEEIVL